MQIAGPYYNMPSSVKVSHKKASRRGLGPTLKKNTGHREGSTLRVYTVVSCTAWV